MLSFLAGSIPVILLIYSAGPVMIDHYIRTSGIKAIFMCHFPAQSAGTLAPIVLGERSPAARLPYTWYKGDVQV